MEWVHQSPQFHSTFGNLGFMHADGYHINENCNAALETILQNIISEDKYLRTYRRSISFGQNIKKDLIPLLIHAKEDKTIELLIKVLVNLSIPIECLLSVDDNSKTDFGLHTIYEINNLLAATKVAFTDQKATKVVIDFLKKNANIDQNSKLCIEQCANINNSLLLLRNILHIPEDSNTNNNGSIHNMQNQIIWNIFSQSVDKMMIKLMTIPNATHWGVTMVQFIALLYKDQHVVTLHKLINLWLEATMSDSSEDNESNTTPPDRGSNGSSPMLTSDPTSDSSDTGGSGKSNDGPNSMNNRWDANSANNPLENGNQQFPIPMVIEKAITQKQCEPVGNTKDIFVKPENDKSFYSRVNKSGNDQAGPSKLEKNIAMSETSDCGYGTQIENQESISTSSNEDEVPFKKPVHQKPHNPKRRVNNKTRTNVISQDRKRIKIVRRGKANIINVQGLSHETPTDDDVSSVLKEFTVDFLLKGYNSLVQTLHNQILTNLQLEIDTSHFFWLVTYFLKFATQIELDLEHVKSVLSFDIISYLIAEGVNLCEQFELAIKLDGNDIKPSIRRLHLVVTAIREFVQAIEAYKKFSHICKAHQDMLVQLQIKMCETEELRSLLVLLLRHYNPKFHSKQYLQDLIVTNHILLLFLDNVMKMPEYKGSASMVDHIKQFATPEIMNQYGILLEDYRANGEFVNDCIFTVMHHVGGEIGCLITLFQPNILKTFSSIWKSEFEICDDWSDLVEYVINTFIKKPHTLHKPTNFRLETESFEDVGDFLKPIAAPSIKTKNGTTDAGETKTSIIRDGNSAEYKWSEDELSSLNWNYVQCSASSDVVGEIVRLFKEDGVTKARDSVICELLKLNLIDQEKYEKFPKGESERNYSTDQLTNEMRDDEISKLCEQLANDGKTDFLNWVQRVLLETCFAKIYIDKKTIECAGDDKKQTKIINFDLFKNESHDSPIVSPVSYHARIYNRSVPLVPWNCAQANICKDLKFLQLLHKIGFHMPVDTGKVFIRIPNFWTADVLYDVAGKITPIDTSKLKFSVNDILSSSRNTRQTSSYVITSDLSNEITMLSTPDNFYQIHKQKHLAAMVNFTPMPGSSFNQGMVEHDKQNWLEIVKRSHESFIQFNIRNSTIMEVDHVIGPRLPATKDIFALPLLEAAERAQGLNDDIVMCSKAESTHLSEPEFYNHSVCETASVASDLTRMYVSDEDEKSEPILPSKKPATEEQFFSDSDHIIAEKRRRTQFSPNFE